MFRQKGKSRTYKQNKKIAALLSLIAGIVNVTGILAVMELTTNVTGHFGFLVEHAFKLEFSESLAYFLYVLFFFLGSFVSSLFIEVVAKVNDRYTYVIPTIMEIMILSALAIYGESLLATNPKLIAYTLLFAMGLQNALVTLISNTIVRTTHLTGLFTDLGIEVSQLLFYHTRSNKIKLLSSINLRLIIIFNFFLGGVVGGVFYALFGFYVLFIPVALLMYNVFYSSMKFRVKQLTERFE